jgi:gas vesicle protein
MTTQSPKGSSGKVLITVALIIAIAAVGYFVLNAPDQRTTGEKIGNAIDELPNGADEAVKQLEDRTLGEKLDDAVKDAGNDLDEAVKDVGDDIENTDVQQ